MSGAQQSERIETWLAQDGKINMRERLASVSDCPCRPLYPIDAVPGQTPRSHVRSGSAALLLLKYLSQPIARMANIEDGCKGHSRESRFKCQRLLDEAALLSAMVHVDLNPVRAAMAQDLEDSDYSSIQQRIRNTALKLGSGGNQLEAVVGVHGTGSLSISIAQYLNLVGWIGRQMHPGKRGKIDPERPLVSAGFRGFAWLASSAR